jgi:large subunit ribosomal protein L9
MKVILTQDVEKLGAAHEVVSVADGFARNYLLPRSMAVVATKSAIANLDNNKRIDERRQTRLRGAAETVAGQLEGKTVVMPARIGTNGRLYGSINTIDIAAQLKESLGQEIDRKQISLAEPIRSAGVYSVPVVLHRDVTATINVQVGDAPAETQAVELAPAEAVAAGSATEAAA